MYYCLCYFKDISTDMFEGKVLEERDPDLNEEEDIRMTYSKILALSWYVYTKDK